MNYFFFFFIFQTVLLNMLSSEFVIIDNPLPGGNSVTGIYLLNHNLYIYGSENWIKFDMRGNRQEDYVAPLDMSDWMILRMNI